MRALFFLEKEQYRSPLAIHCLESPHICIFTQHVLLRIYYVPEYQKFTDE